MQLAVTTASVYAVETCADVVSDLFRYGGGRVLALANPMQRHLRNVLAARQHLALSEENYEAAGPLPARVRQGPPLRRLTAGRRRADGAEKARPRSGSLS